MTIGIMKGEHTFVAVINQIDKVISPINLFNEDTRMLLKAPGIKPLIFAARSAVPESVKDGFIVAWKVTVTYKWFGLRTIVSVQPHTYL